MIISSSFENALRMFLQGIPNPPAIIDSRVAKRSPGRRRVRGTSPSLRAESLSSRLLLGAPNTPTRQFPRSQSSLHLPTTMVRALFVVATLALSCSAVLAHEGHDHGSMAAGSTAGSHAGSGEDHHNHDAGETGSAHGSATGSSGVSGTAAVPTPAPSSATTVFSIALPLTAAAVATLAATN